MPPMDDEEGVKNLDSALSGETSLQGMNREQIEAMGGEFDELDEFKASATDRGDIIDEDGLPPKSDENEEQEDGAEDADEEGEEEAEAEDAESEGDEGDGDESDESDDDSTADESSESDASEGEDSDEKAEQGDKDTTPKRQENRIPKSRFDEVNARRKAAEEELAALKAEREAEKQGSENKYDFDAAEEEYMELLLSGKTKEAGAKRAEIRAAEHAEWEAEVRTTSTETAQAERVQVELQDRVELYTDQYEAFDPESESYSDDLVDEVETFFTGYLERRKDLSPAQAFDLAVDTAVKLYGLQKRGEEGATEESEPETPPKNVVRKAKKQTKKKTELARKAPKDTSKAGQAGDSSGTTQYDIDNMTDDELDALPESTLKRLRGDTL